MKRMIVFAGMLLCASPLMAETYSWTDASGTMNFTEDLSEVPKKFRKKVRIRGDVAPSPPPVQKNDGASGAKGKVVERSVGREAKETPSPETNYGGKSLEAWKQEIIAADSEVKALDAKVNELAAQITAGGEYVVSRSQIELQKEYNQAVEALNRASARYNEKVMAARNAGAPL